MSYAVVANEPSNPIDVRLFGSLGIVKEPQFIANLVEQATFGRFGLGRRETLGLIP